MTWNRYSRMMIGIGMPRAHNRMPRMMYLYSLPRRMLCNVVTMHGGLMAGASRMSDYNLTRTPARTEGPGVW